ncbi:MULTISPECIES: NAD+ synthase [Prochlorococcus]|uniref:Glutamine-dependent NAD(+) synthetase n=1 Tax=Prochlorococcus marinus (strain SARG / CCMP1375 / SS120) TaxID=167539 RepID=Q7VA68_PROMA|nr:MULTISPECIES: NAD+ synthase [Prochlorococcus]AAQ00643.1 NAD synthase [Prochlorococcus marinus subsp. marinus str. CCMP1375]KGG10862.1 NAD synthetase [Prochlorococcus marinus str. LG]KGG20442.1 NAD synthetase [Prochlorococcus marinus str. SS2]KGG24111.1 NAD synthetase [Prochlorococcus marinus str. SS35]KGG31632.1 NAD synthetase [Prochlorococcus marinus str. SS51]
MRLSLAQLNPLIGDLSGNSKKIIAACKDAYKNNANLLITPELSILGYPPRDLLFNPLFLEHQWDILDEIVTYIAEKTPQLTLLVGIAEPAQDLQVPNLFNSIALLKSSGWEVIARKQLLPTYDVFDEKRYFRAAQKSGVILLTENERTWRLGLTICEDLWVEEGIQGHRIEGPDPIADLTSKKIDLLLNLSASPFTHGKGLLRQRLASKAAKRLNCPVIYLNQVGGNDELIFDGSSFITDQKGKKTLSLPLCKESIVTWDATSNSSISSPSLKEDQEILLQALVLGVKDYVGKCGFKSVLLGLSGGIDSALVAIIACAALGAEKVSGILMPSPWSSEGSIIDANNLAKRLGIKTSTIPIASLMENYDITLKTTLGKLPQGLTAENLQARIRGTLLMAIANEQKHLLLSTGNKSELAVGYCTLYGDMNGGLAVIGDLYKTNIFDLCHWLDSNNAYQCRSDLGLPKTGDLVGSAILNKPPSAELSPNQLDSDSLPDYEVLDKILKALIEDRSNYKTLASKEYPSALVTKVKKLLKNAEFKRRQAPPTLKVSEQAFGSGWRIPIAST